MKVEFRTLSRVMSTLVVLFVLCFGMGLNASAQERGRDWGRSHNHGRHLGWTRGRRVGQYRRNDSNWRSRVRRERRFERRTLRSQRRSNWNNNQNWQRSRVRQSGNWRRRNQ